MSHDHYKKDVRHLDMIDVYRVIELFEVTHPALQHALKKVLCAGDRGAKDWEKDVQEAIDSLNRALQMRVEDEASSTPLTEAQMLLMTDPMGYVQKHAKAQTNDDPHAELRKTWKPGQRWQCRARGMVDWNNIPKPEKPMWMTTIEYRRHPDDAKEGHD